MVQNLIFCCQQLSGPTLHGVYFDILDVLSILRELDKTMVWQSARYICLKSETRFKTLGPNVIIWDPAMVSITKTQLTIRQNINKVKIQKFHFFFNCGFGFLCIRCCRSLNMGPRPCSLLQEGHFFSKFNYIKQNIRGCQSYLKILKS
jgi:hypothetical protein